MIWNELIFPITVPARDDTINIMRIVQLHLPIAAIYGYKCEQ